MTAAVVETIVAVVGVIPVLGAVRGDRANSEEHAGLSSQIENVDPDVKELHAEIRALRTETRAGFKPLSEQIEELNTNASGADETR